jgi:predicted ATPase
MMKERLVTSTNHANSKLYGRKEELQVLQEVYQKATLVDEQVQCVFCSGASGTGKSTLIQRAFSTKQCLYGSGKFEATQSLQNKPFRALIHCIGEICTRAAARNSSNTDECNDNEKHSCKKILQNELKEEEIDTLVDVFPEIRNLACGSSVGSAFPNTASSATTTSSRSKEGLEKLKYALRLFLRAMACPECPVVLCLDDLHWMDPASLDLLEAILTDTELTNVVFVGSFRTNEETTEDLLQWIHGSIPKSTRLEIGDLTINTVEELLQDLLQTHQVNDLAQLVYSKTHGNIFHVLQLVDYLQSEQLLEYSLSKFQWTWDITRLKEETCLSDNVVAIVSRRLHRLSPQVLSCLQLASCLSFRFDPRLLYTIKDAMESGDESMLIKDDDVDASLEKAIYAGILERLNERRVKFAHDRIHQAVLGLFGTKEERNRVHLNIGKILWKEYELEDAAAVCESLDDRKLFVCVDQLNIARQLITATDFRVDLARLNCEASKRAASFSAFVPSLEYLLVGVELLEPQSRWQNHYDLTLELYTSMAEMSFVLDESRRAKRPSVRSLYIPSALMTVFESIWSKREVLQRRPSIPSWSTRHWRYSTTLVSTFLSNQVAFTPSECLIEPRSCLKPSRMKTFWHCR